MAIVGTGKWTQGNDPNTSVQSRDYFSGDLTIDNAAYADDKEYEFGFAPGEIVIENTGSGVLVWQWLRNKGKSVDNGVLTAGQERVLRFANKEGIRLRHEGGSTTARITANG
jgi:hypothetical protein